MEDSKKIKTLITRINHICDSENKSLAESLSKYNLTPVKYLKLLGLNINIEQELEIFLNELFQNKDTRVYFNPSMESISKDCIEISSNSSNKSISFLNNEIRLYEIKQTEDEEKYYENIITTIIDNTTFINYIINKVITKEELSKRIISKKYNIKHVNIKVNFKIDNIENSFEFTINNDLVASDLDYAKRLLDNKKLKH